MSKTRSYLLTLKEARSPAPADLEQVARCVGRIIDRAGRTVKVEVEDAPAASLSDQLPGWHVQPEITYKVPDTRRKVESPPDNLPSSRA